MPANAHLVAMDAVAALVIGSIIAYSLVDLSPRPLWVAVHVALVVAVPLVLRRRAPIRVLLVVVVATVVLTGTGVLPLDALGAPLTAVAFAVYTAGLVVASVWPLLFAVGGMFFVVLVRQLVERSRSVLDLVYFLLVTGLVLGVTWVAGWTSRVRRAYVARAQEQSAEQALAEERLRIARELHDVVAHGLTVITVTASTANHVAEDDPEEARRALRVVETTGREALAEMRHLLGVLRSPGSLPELGPAPDLSGLAELAERAAAAGVRVRLDVSGDDPPEGVALSVHRIVQEAVTNVVRHAAPARCDVVVRNEGGVVRVDVTDDGPGGDDLTGGHGLLGMRERVAVYGGSFSAGPRPDGGFAVSATLPHGRRRDPGRDRGRPGSAARQLPAAGGQRARPHRGVGGGRRAGGRGAGARRPA